jgi:hypothetical protein
MLVIRIVGLIPFSLMKLNNITWSVPPFKYVSLLPIFMEVHSKYIILEDEGHPETSVTLTLFPE